MQEKTVAVLGGGHGAHAMAADLVAKGFRVNFFEMERFKDNVQTVLDSRRIRSIGVLEGVFELAKATTCIDEAITDAHYILVVTPAFAHKAYAQLLKGRLRADQVVIFYPGAFASLLFASAFGDAPLPVLAEVNNLPYDARLAGPGKVNILGRNPVNIAFFPAAAAAGLIDAVRALHPFERVYTDVLESGLSIVNPTIHTGLCLLSVTAIEHSHIRPFFLYEHGVTPASCRLQIALDQERKAIGRALGYDLTPIEDFSGMPPGYTWQQFYMHIHGNISLTPISGPDNIQNRYFTEDAPYGLVPWSSLGKVLGVATPLIDAALGIYAVIHATDWRAAGRNLDDLGLAGMDVAAIHRFVRTGRT
jgi:opine dehydrogenase